MWLWVHVEDNRKLIKKSCSDEAPRPVRSKNSQRETQRKQTMTSFLEEVTPFVYIIHDRSEWLDPYRKALSELGVPFKELDLRAPHWFDLSTAPPPGLYFNRSSPSSHTRGNRYAMELASAVIDWLESHNCTVINGSASMKLEMSKIAQEIAMTSNEIPVAHSSFYSSQEALLDSLKNNPERFSFANGFCLKHNRGGSGSGVRLFDSVDQAIRYVESDEWEAPIDGITLVQERILSPQNCMYRLEFVDGILIYVIMIDTSTVSTGSVINNCPADSCTLKERARQRKLEMDKSKNASNNGSTPVACPLKFQDSSKFKISLGFKHPIVERISAYVASKQMGTAGVEIIVDENEDAFVIDFNATNTNYNRAAEKRANIPMRGATAVAKMLRRYWLKSPFNDTRTPS